MNQLTEELKEQYKKGLKISPKKDFYEEFERTAELEMKIIEKHGFEGLKIVLKKENLYNLGSLPIDCPWYFLNNLSIQDAISSIFSVQGKNIESDFIDEIQNRCLFLVAEKNKKEWQLHYVIQYVLHTNKPYYSLITGNESLSIDLLHSIFNKIEWELDKDLSEIYLIHNGLFKDGITLIQKAEFITNIEKIYPDFENDTGIKPKDVLCIADDGAGNLIGYVRNHEYLRVVDIEHETLELTNKYGIYGYLDSNFEHLDEIDSDDEYEDDLMLEDSEKPYTEIKFGKKYSITSTTKISTEVIQKYKDIAPPALIYLWETQGLPSLNKGILTFINPDDYIEMLDLWLGKHKANYIPFAIGAFGTLFYYRKLTKNQEDVCVIDPHFREIDTCEWSFRDFFEDYINDEYTLK